MKAEHDMQTPQKVTANPKPSILYKMVCTIILITMKEFVDYHLLFALEFLDIPGQAPCQMG